jgi:hypothetical protein
MRREYAVAGKWYEDALEDMSAEQKQQLIPFRLIHAMGKNHDRNRAAVELAQAFYADPLQGQPIDNQRLASSLLAQLLQPRPFNENELPNPKFQNRLRHDCHLAEAFLGVGDLKGGETWFASETGDADEILSSRLMRSQFLLFQSRWSEYADCICDEILPRMVSDSQVMLAALPLGYAELLAKLHKERVESIKNRLMALRDKAKGNGDKLLVDMLLREVARYLKDDNLVEIVNKRLAIEGQINGDWGNSVRQIQANRKMLDGDWITRVLEGD